MKIEIKYDGENPNLCSGKLIVIIDGKEWLFPNGCMTPGGSITFDEDWNEYVEQGEWDINPFPQGFPKELESSVIDAVNDQVEWGNCGGCV